jgi:hypothetical protein
VAFSLGFTLSVLDSAPALRVFRDGAVFSVIVATST